MIKSFLKTITKFSKYHQPQIVDPTDYYNNRKQTLAGLNNYPYNFKITTSVEEFLKKYNQNIEKKDEYVAGRILSIRKHGKLSFVDIKQSHHKVQVAIEKMDQKIKRGDIIGIKGQPFRTHKGQLTVKAEEVILLAPCFHMLPEQDNLKDVQIKHRKKYLDLLTNKDSHQKLKIRAHTIRFLRNYLTQKGFLEVQTPSLSASAGGAIAKPFETYLHEMDLNLYMRIAPELYLKQLLVGGIPKVFELGKNFRNQGIDPTHNPQFTSLQLYETYKNYEDMMTMTQNMMKQLVKQTTGKYQLVVGDKIINFQNPWKRISFIDGIEEAIKTKLPKQFQSKQSTQFLDKICKQHKIQCASPRTSARLLDKLSSHFLQNTDSPLFIYKYPTCMSPLAKPCQDNPSLTQRFQGFINGWQICNSYTELNDPQIQLKNTPTDLQFVECLEHGLPPCAGWGLGVDRLVMLLTNSSTIQQILAFPLTKPMIKQI